MVKNAEGWNGGEYSSTPLEANRMVENCGPRAIMVDKE